jgi:hypothetical protein
MPETTSSTPARRSSGGRTAAVIAGAIAALVAFGLIAVGGVLLWGNAQKDRDGFISTGSDRFHTRTYALATDDLDVDTDAPSWVEDSLGRIRLRAESHAGKPVFVGIAPTRDVNAYLRGTAHATVTDVDYEPFRASYRTHSGAGRPAAPSAQRFWVANAEGAGRQTLTWKVRDGSWSIVVMNADGSANVDAGVSAGTDAPWLSAAGWGSLGGGLLLLAVAGALVAVGVRRPRADREPAGLAPAAA